jgi:pimeloyl-ACP methyl ester carboxylesterase
MTGMTTKTEMTTHTLEVPGAVLTYDVRHNESSTHPVLLLIGSPMGAAGFGSLAGHFTDRTIVTYDPRGSERSTKPDMRWESTPDEHADDVHRIIQELGGGPVDLRQQRWCDERARAGREASSGRSDARGA